MFRKAIIVLVLTLLAQQSLAQTTSAPTGLWQYNNEDGTPRALIRISRVEDGTLRGIIETPFPKPGEPANPVCEACEGALKNAPIQGLPILQNVRWDGEEWTGGTILDADSGTTYDVTLTPLPNNQLQVRGYMGISLLGRTAIWTRKLE